MTKLEYLRNVFAHTKGKTFENYVINQIWAKVEDLGLYPVTQQYVKRQNGRYALMDLYFPQINLAVEVNEKPHLQNIKADKMRYDDILRSVPEIEVEAVIETDYADVKKQINALVKKIAKKVNKDGKLKWEENWRQKEYESKLSAAKKKRKLRVSDSISFKRIQVTNDIFGKNFTEDYLKRGRSTFKVSEDGIMWFPHLTPNKNWKNTISKDWKEITQEYIGEEPLNEKPYNLKLKLYTFAKYRDTLGEISYRFVGVFKVKKQTAKITTYKLVSDEIPLK